MKKTITFYECEHDGDLNNYTNEIIECGAKIVSTDPDFDEETCEVEISVTDYEKFYSLFKKTDSFGLAEMYKP